MFSLNGTTILSYFSLKLILLPRDCSDETTEILLDCSNLTLFEGSRENCWKEPGYNR